MKEDNLYIATSQHNMLDREIFQAVTEIVGQQIHFFLLVSLTSWPDEMSKVNKLRQMKDNIKPS